MLAVIDPAPREKMSKMRKSVATFIREKLIGPKVNQKVCISQRRSVRKRRLLCEQLEGRRLLTSYIVDTVSDAVANDGFVSLREAIQAANTNLAVNEAAAGQVASDAIDSITFAPTLAGATITLNGTELTLSDSITISAGQAGSVVLDAGQLSRVLSISGSAALASISGLTLSGGTASVGGGIAVMGSRSVLLDDVVLRGNVATGATAAEGGGGLYNDGANLIITGGIISGNTASGASGSGGGILSLAGSLSIEGTQIESNVASRAGGGIELGVGSLTLSGVTLGGLQPSQGNVAGPAGSAAPGNGGGLHVSGGSSATTVAIAGGSVLNNFAASEGGGLWNQRGALMTISAGTLVSGNIAAGTTNQEGGGGVFNNGGLLDIDDAQITNNATTGMVGGGGGVANDGGVVNVARTIIASNFAAGSMGSGGGVLNLNNGRFVFVDSEISGNVASRAGGGIEEAADSPGVYAITLRNTLLSDNNAGVIDGDATAASPGNGGGLHVSGRSDVRIVDSLVTENIAALEGGGLWNGSGLLVVENSSIERNSAFGDAADDGGGGIFNNGGTVVVDGSTITSNFADGTAGSGGGILNLGGVLTVTDSEISDNISSRAGGGIEVTAGSTTTLDGVMLSGNSTGPSPGNGGGLHITGDGMVIVTSSEVNDNFASAEGGGLWNSSVGTLQVVDTMIVGNVASGAASDQGGGGVFNDGGTLQITRSTISGNVADGAAGSGGGLLTVAGDVQLTNTSLEFNGANRAGGGIEIIAGTLLLTNSNLINNDVDGTATGGMAAPGNGGGLHVSGVASVTLDGGIVFGNVAALEGGGLWNQAGSTLTVQNGTRIEANLAFGDAADDGGGGIFNNGGTVVVDGSTITSNFADGTAGSGGGILNLGGVLTVTDSEISDNISSRAGGGIEVTAGSTTSLDGVMLSGNSTGPSPGNGGGLHITGDGMVIVTSSEVNDNFASAEGGGLWNSSNGTLNVTSSTISGNSAVSGGGLYSDGDGGTILLVNSTVASNTATTGGGITVDGGSIEITSATIAYNDAESGGGLFISEGNIRVWSSIIGSNTAVNGTNVLGTLDSDGFNVFGLTDGLVVLSPGTNDMFNVDPLLSTLADNGGPDAYDCTAFRKPGT